MVYPGGFTLKSRVALFTKKAPSSNGIPPISDTSNETDTAEEKTLIAEDNSLCFKDDEANNNESSHHIVHSTPLKLECDEETVTKTKVQWSTEQVEALLNSVNDHLEDFRGRMVHTRVWRRIGLHLAEQYPHLTPQHCYNKWKNLRRDVRLALSNPTRALRNPGILRRAAMLAALVYPNGQEADPAFLQQLDLIQSSLPSQEAKKSGTGSRGGSRCMLAMDKSVQELVLENNQSTMAGYFVGRDAKPDTSEDDQDSCPPTNGGRFSPSPTTSDAAAPSTDMRKQSDIIAALTASFIQQNQSSSHNSSAVFPPSGNELNTFMMNPSLLVNSNYFLQSIAASSDTSSVQSNLNGFHQEVHGEHDIIPPHGSSMSEVLHHQHMSSIPPLPCVDSLDQVHGGPSPTKQRCTTPVVPGPTLPGYSPKLSVESLRELVQNFRNDESNRIATIDTLVSVIGELQSDSQRRLDALNRLVALTQCNDQVPP